MDDQNNLAYDPAPLLPSRTDGAPFLGSLSQILAAEVDCCYFEARIFKTRRFNDDKVFERIRMKASDAFEAKV